MSDMDKIKINDNNEKNKIDDEQQQQEEGGEKKRGGEKQKPVVPFSFPKRRNRGNIRKKKRAIGELLRKDDEKDDDDDDGGVQHKKLKQRKSLEFSTKKKETEGDEIFALSGNRRIQQANDQGATRLLETETEYDKDARALREKTLKHSKDGGEVPEGVYRGMKSYVDYRQGFRKESTVSQEKATGAHGPLRGSLYVRSSVRFDYQPDICKDYKETGFCSYGDSCKFLHDRGDYKSGWELEREYDEEHKRKMDQMIKGLEGGDDDDDISDDVSDDDLPFACFICRSSWEEAATPVVTQCKHYFCETCALQHHTKTGKCYVCDKATRGVFNVAKEISKKTKERKAKQASKEAAQKDN